MHHFVSGICSCLYAQSKRTCTHPLFLTCLTPCAPTRVMLWFLLSHAQSSLFPWFDRCGHMYRARMKNCQFPPLFHRLLISRLKEAMLLFLQSEVSIWTVAVKGLGTLQFRQWHISRCRSTFLGCRSTVLLWEWKEMARSEIYKWEFTLNIPMT